MSKETQICVPLCVRLAADLKQAFYDEYYSDIVELRLDYLPDTELRKALPIIEKIVRVKKRRTIITLRPQEFGGARALTLAERLSFRSENPSLFLSSGPNVYLDIEHDLAQQFQADWQAAPWKWNQTICSYHNFTESLGDLEAIYEQIARTPAAIIKIAFSARDTVDCLPVFRLLERAQREGRELIAIAMGHAGIMTRILGPSHGSFLTYAAFDAETATAPGQVTADDIVDVYRIRNVNKETQVFGLVGQPVAHSISPVVHNAAFKAANMNAVYLPFEVANVIRFVDEMIEPRSRLLEWNLRGLSVTAPHKTTIMERLTHIDPLAKVIGAVNTVTVRDGSLHGYNTDAAGFISVLQHLWGPLKGARVGVIGAGGAGRAVVATLRKEKARVAVFSRNPDKAESLCLEFKAESRPLKDATFKKFDIVVNATPLGTRGALEDQTPVTADQLRGVWLAYDLVYNPWTTEFLTEAAKAGCKTVNGFGMFVMQAAEQLRLWTGEEPDVEMMYATANVAVHGSSGNSERSIQSAGFI